MGLHWDLTKIQNHETKCWDGTGDDAKMNEVTNALIWFTLFVGIQDINEKTLLDFWGRVCIIQADGKSGKLTFEHVVSHMGLHTNATPQTYSKFLSNQRRVWKEREERDAKKAAEQAVAA